MSNEGNLEELEISNGAERKLQNTNLKSGHIPHSNSNTNNKDGGVAILVNKKHSHLITKFTSIRTNHIL